jgi:hypothetical protein
MRASTIGKMPFFGSQELFSTVWAVAAENEVIFGGSCGLPKILPYFHRSIYDRQKLKEKQPKVIGPPKIELLLVFFHHWVGESNCATRNRKFSYSRLSGPHTCASLTDVMPKPRLPLPKPPPPPSIVRG